MKAGGALVLVPDAREAAYRAVAQARAALGDRPPALAILFASAHFLGSAETLAAAVAEQTGHVPLVGCVAEAVAGGARGGGWGQAVAGGAREVESAPAVSLWLGADLGPVETFSMEFLRTSSGGAFGGYRFGPGPHLLISDPFTFPADVLLAHLNENVPGALVVGGMASGGGGARQGRLFLAGRGLSPGARGGPLPGAARGRGGGGRGPPPRPAPRPAPPPGGRPCPGRRGGPRR